GRSESDFGWRRHTGRSRTSWRSCQADILNRQHVNGILDARANVLRFQIRVVILDDLSEGKPFTDELKHALHRNPRTGNTRLAEMDLWADRDSFFHTCPCLFQAVYASRTQAASKALASCGVSMPHRSSSGSKPSLLR